MSRVHKFFLGHSVVPRKKTSALRNQLYTVLRIWRNYSHHDFGLERIIRLFLACAQFLSFGLYIKQLLRNSTSTMRKIAIEVYVLFKLCFPLLALKFGWIDKSWVLYLVIYFLFETVIYVTSLIFIADASRESVQPRRSLALLFLNFFEIVFDFAFMYAYFEMRIPNFFTRDLHGGIDSIYFSFVTAATVGYGDIAPLASLAEKLAIAQISLTFIFVGLFLNYFANLLHRVSPVATEQKYTKTRHRAKKKSD
jgi:hypothetical protein